MSSRADRIFRALVRVFPFDFRADHGRDMEQTLRAQHREARREGVRTLIGLWLEILRDVVTTAPREHVAILRQDFAYALRALRRAPVFAVSAVLTLALGMSAMTGMIAIVNAIMFRPLAVEHPEQLMSISNRAVSNRTVPYMVSFRDLQDYRAETTVLADAIGYTLRVASFKVDDGADRVAIEMVTDNYFSMLGMQPAAGRLIQPNEGRAKGDAPVVVLASWYWRSRFGSDPSIIGKPVRVNGRPFTIIGVTSPTFRGTESLVRVAAYVPAWMHETFVDAPSAQSLFEDRAARMFTVLGRLKPGISLAQARAALDVRAATLAREFPSTNTDVSLRIAPEAQTRPNPQLGEFLRIASAAFVGLAAVVLLITSANVTNLLMARAASRSREVAVRAALGARRGRIMRQFVTESVTIGLLGGLVAIPIVVFALRCLHEFIAGVTAAAALDPDFSVDVRVTVVALATAIVAGILAGLAPAMAVCRSDLGRTLNSGGRSGMNDSGGRLRGMLVVMQVALSLTLLVSGGLFVRSLDHARHIDLGFQPDGMFLASASPGLQGYDSAQRLAFYRSVRDRMAALADVDDAAWISLPPLGIMFQIAQVSPQMRPRDPGWRPPIAFEADVSPEYFATARMRLVRGRGFNTRDDATSTPVVVVNETLASQFWPDQDPIGRLLATDGTTLEVVGVMRDGKYQNVGESPRAAIFRPLAQAVPATATLVTRTSRPGQDLASTVRDIIRDVDPDVGVYDVRPMSTHLDNGNAFFPFRLGAFMTSLFGGMGVLLASIGLYGMIAYHVGQRTQEFGVRMALGASSADIIRDVLARGGRFALIGVAVGIVLAFGLAQLLRGLLLGVRPFDPVTYGAVASLLVAICLIASFIPARRATGLDPLTALRAE